jgi:hypothetical protein
MKSANAMAESLAERYSRASGFYFRGQKMNHQDAKAPRREEWVASRPKKLTFFSWRLGVLAVNLLAIGVGAPDFSERIAKLGIGLAFGYNRPRTLAEPGKGERDDTYQGAAARRDE